MTDRYENVRRALLEERDALAAKLASYERDTALTQEDHND